MISSRTLPSRNADSTCWRRASGRSADGRFRSDRGQQTEPEVETRAGQDLAVAELDRQAYEFGRYFGRAIEELVLSDTD